MSEIEQVKSFTKTKTYIVCPHCGAAENTIQHLLDDKNVKFPYTQSWYCHNDECMRHFSFTIGADRQVSSVEKTDKPPYEVVYDLLVLPPQKEPVYLILKTKNYNPGHPDFRERHYWYEEHTCPTNWTRDIESIISEGDSDPHGLFQFLLRQTKEEVIAAGAADEDGDIDNDAGLIFLDAFYPQHSGGSKNMGMVEEVIPVPPGTFQVPGVPGWPGLLNSQRLTFEQQAALPIFDIEHVKPEDLLNTIEWHALYQDDIEVFRHYHGIVMELLKLGCPVEMKNIEVAINNNGRSGIGRLLTVKAGENWCGAALALSSNLKTIEKIKLLSKTELMDLVR